MANEQMSPQPSEMDVMLENLELIIGVTRRAMNKSKRYDTKRARALSTDSMDDGEELTGSELELDDEYAVETDDAVEGVELNEALDDESVQAVEGETGETAIHLDVPNEAWFFKDPDRAQWAEDMLGARLVEDEVLEIRVPTEVTSDGDVSVIPEVRVWEQVDGKVLEEGFKNFNAERSEMPLAIAYLMGSLHAEHGETGSIPQGYFSHIDSAEAGGYLRVDGDRVVADQWVNFDDAHPGVDAAVLRDAALWLGATDVGSVDKAGIFFPITDELRHSVDELAVGEVPLVLSDVDKFLDADESQLRAWAQRERQVRDGHLDADELHESWTLDAAADVKPLVSEMDNGLTLVTWEREGANVAHPDGAPSLIVDGQNRVVAAGTFEEGRPSGKWAFTDPETRSQVRETCRIDPLTGRAHDTHMRQPNGRMGRAPQFDGAPVFGFGQPEQGASAKSKPTLAPEVAALGLAPVAGAPTLSRAPRVAM